MKKYLPSKEFLKFFGIAVGIGLVVFLSLHFLSNKKRVSQEIQSIATRQIIEELDTDNDGVKDWEEGLWGMDLNNPDSDDDGILDGQEVEMRKEEIKSSGDFVEVLEEPKTETERFARQITTVVLNMNQVNGGQIDEKQMAEVVAGFVEGIQPEMVKQYENKDLNISTTQTAEQYYNEMSEAIGDLSDVHGTEFAIVERAVTLKNKKPNR